jgi:hypothetical protein
MRGKQSFVWALTLCGDYAGTGNLALMLDFRWVRGNNIVVKVVNFLRARGTHWRGIFTRGR